MGETVSHSEQSEHSEQRTFTSFEASTYHKCYIHLELSLNFTRCAHSAGNRCDKAPLILL
jgi:hypothetical protein